MVPRRRAERISSAVMLDSSSMYGTFFEWFATETTAGQALRSTPRAAPLVVLALAFGAGAGTERVRSWVLFGYQDVGELILFVACQPPHVTLNEILITPTYNRFAN